MQTFDYIHRQKAPVPEVELFREVEDLTVWPGFRYVAMGSPLFLVSEDTYDIATAGIHEASPVREIILQTLDLVRVPLNDFTLLRLVRRLRPDLREEENPIEGLLRESGELFRPRIGHVARRQWLKEAYPLGLKPDLPTDLGEAARQVIAESGGLAFVAPLAAALAERADRSITEIYRALGDDASLLLLPGGFIGAYDPIAEEIERLLARDAPEEPTPPAPVFLAEELAELSPDLIHRVLQRCQRSGPISTTEILTEILGLTAESSDWVQIFRQVTAKLGLTPDLVQVGQNRWAAFSTIPAQLFQPLRGTEGAPGSQVAAALLSGNDLPQMGDGVAVRLTHAMLTASAIQSGHLKRLLPEQPLIQQLRWEGLPGVLWYNAEWGLLLGLEPWLRERRAQEGDLLILTQKGGCLQGYLRKGVAPLPTTGTLPPERPRTPRPSAFSPAVLVELLDQAGGALTCDELLALAAERDPEVEWANIAPLFRRLPFLRLEGDLCLLVRATGAERRASSEEGTIRARVLNLLADHPVAVRADPAVQLLAHLAARFPRLTGREEAELLPLAQAGQGAEWEHLILANLRHALVHLLRRKDLYYLLPHIEDLFQTCFFGIAKVIDRFDPAISPRLMYPLNWWLRQRVNRALPEMLFPVVYPVHKFGELYPIELRRVKQEEPPDPTWAELSEAYEAGELTFRAHTLSLGVDPVAEAEAKAVAVGLREALECLGQREQYVIRRRFGFDGLPPATLEEVGQALEITRERVRQIEKKILERWRRLPCLDPD